MGAGGGGERWTGSQAPDSIGPDNRLLHDPGRVPSLPRASAFWSGK